MNLATGCFVLGQMRRRKLDPGRPSSLAMANLGKAKAPEVRLATAWRFKKSLALDNELLYCTVIIDID